MYLLHKKKTTQQLQKVFQKSKIEAYPLKDGITQEQAQHSTHCLILNRKKWLLSPSNWTLNFAGVRGCGRSSTGTLIADSAFYPVNGITYSKVCGRVTDAFYPYYRLNQRSIEQSYVNGVSLTYGAKFSKISIMLIISGYKHQLVRQLHLHQNKPQK